LTTVYPINSFIYAMVKMKLSFGKLAREIRSIVHATIQYQVLTHQYRVTKNDLTLKLYSSKLR